MVESVKTEDRSPRSGFVDRNYTLTVTIKSAEKGTVENDADSILVQGWEAWKRPEGFAGPGGHYTHPRFRRLSDIKAGVTLRLFLRREKGRTYAIVSPNGFEIIDGDGKPKSK